MWKLMFGDKLVSTSDYPYANGAIIVDYSLDGAKEFRVVSRDETEKICRVLEVVK